MTTTNKTVPIDISELTEKYRLPEQIVCEVDFPRFCGQFFGYILSVMEVFMSSKRYTAEFKVLMRLVRWLIVVIPVPSVSKPFRCI